MQLKENVPQYGMIDFVKFLGALLIVIAHYVTENAQGRINSFIDYAISLYVIVVPFFFCSAGFLLFIKVFAISEKAWIIVKKYCQRILRIYLSWSVVYIAFKVATWIRFGVTCTEVTKYILNAICYSTYKTIWFLPALCIGVLLSYVFVTKLGVKRTAFIAVIFYLVGASGVSYSFIIEKNRVLSNALAVYTYIFESTRNGFFNGFPFVMAGACIAYELQQGKQLKPFFNFACTCIFGIAFVAEAFILKLKFGAINANTLLFLVPFTYFFVKLLISFPVSSGGVLRWMRKMSTTIFLCQRIYLSALPALLPESFFAAVLRGNPYIGCIYVLSMTIISAEALILLSRKSKSVHYAKKLNGQIFQIKR